MPAPLPAAQRRAILASDPGTGRLTARPATCEALAKRGLAVRHGRLGDHYLTAEGLRVRAELAVQDTPPPAGEVPPAGGFTADDGHGVRIPPDPGRAAEVAAAWSGLLEIRRVLQDGDTTRPAPWERERYVHAVALALEAAGQPPSARDGRGRASARGYSVTAWAQDGVARVLWHAPDAAPDPGSRDHTAQLEALAGCRDVLHEHGWQCTLHRDRAGRLFLLASPLRAPA